MNACKQLLEVWLDDRQAGALAQHLKQVIIAKEVEPGAATALRHTTNPYHAWTSAAAWSH